MKNKGLRRADWKDEPSKAFWKLNMQTTETLIINASCLSLKTRSLRISRRQYFVTLSSCTFFFFCILEKGVLCVLTNHLHEFQNMNPAIALNLWTFTVRWRLRWSKIQDHANFKEGKQRKILGHTARMPLKGIWQEVRGWGLEETNNNSSALQWRGGWEEATLACSTGPRPLPGCSAVSLFADLLTSPASQVLTQQVQKKPLR